MVGVRFLYGLVQEPYRNHTETIHKPRSWSGRFRVRSPAKVIVKINNNIDNKKNNIFKKISNSVNK
jgi:hypothetical protein